MKRTLAQMAIAASLAMAGVAFADEPMNPYEAPPPPPPAQPINPYGNGYGYGYGAGMDAPPPPPLYPPPSAYGYQPPMPGQYNSTPPSYQQGYYLYAAPGTPPIYYAPPPVVFVRPRLTCPQLCAERRGPKKWDGIRRFSIGIHATAMGINQKVGSNDVILAGAGIQLRFRSRGHFAVEFSQSFLHANYWNGGFVRNSFPFDVSLMGYVFKNEDRRHFNLYFLGGVGLMPDDVRIRFQPGDYREQDFMEWTLHAGVGAELRFKWFAIEADARGLLLVLDRTGTPASYYDGVSGGLVPSSGWAWQANVHLSLWF